MGSPIRRVGRVAGRGYIVVHSIECPPGPSWAEALGGPAYFQSPATRASVHYIVDADSIVQGVREDQWAWGSGSPSSKHGIHIEQAGYASMSRAQWSGDPSAVGSTYQRPDGRRVTYTADDAASMRSQFQLLARLIADICTRHNWDPVAATAADLVREVRGATLGRHIRHRDATAWVGGTSHTDPGEHYPWDDLLARAAHYMGSTPDTPDVPPAPPVTTHEEIEMFLVQAKGTNKKTYVGTFDAAGVRHIDSPQMLDALKKAGLQTIPVSAGWWNANRARNSIGVPA